jgi:hypothetical protein
MDPIHELVGILDLQSLAAANNYRSLILNRGSEHESSDNYPQYRDGDNDTP